MRSPSRSRHLFEHPIRGFDEVVLAYEPAVFADATGELFELKLDEPTVGPELHHVALDLLGDAPHHLRALQHRRNVAHGHQIFDFQCRQRAAHTVEARLVPAEDLQRLVATGQHSRDRLEGLLVAAVVHRDDTHLLRDREHWYRDLTSDALRGAVAGTGFAGGDVGVGNEVHVGTRDARTVGREDDRTVHLREFGEPLRRELGVEQEAAGADVENLGSVADDDERAHLGLENAVDPLPQRGAGSDQAQRTVESFRPG